MIKTDKGQTEISGDIASILADIGVASKVVKDVLVENGISEDKSKEKIIDMVQKGFMSEEEITKAIKDKITSLLGGCKQK